MLASFLLSVREGFEIVLIIGIVLAALRKMDRGNLYAPVWQGVLAALGVSLLAGLGFTWLGAEFEGRGEQIFEGVSMLVAAVFLTWMIIWMRRQSGSLQRNLESEVKEASKRQSSHWALFGLAFLAVVREGFELAIFLTAVKLTSDGLQTFIGAVLGLGLAVALGWVLFTSSKRLSLRTFFNVTNVLLVLFAAGLLAHGVAELNEASIIPAMIEHVWNINPILNEESPIGQVLVAFFGYNGDPALSEMLAYAAYLVVAWALWKKLAGMPVVKTTPAHTHQAPNGLPAK